MLNLKKYISIHFGIREIAHYLGVEASPSHPPPLFRSYRQRALHAYFGLRIELSHSGFLRLVLALSLELRLLNCACLLLTTKLALSEFPTLSVNPPNYIVALSEILMRKRNTRCSPFNRRTHWKADRERRI